jgi:RNA polymerase sigma-70 factor (ECF subfamily)
MDREEALARPSFETLYRVAHASLPDMLRFLRFQPADVEDLIQDTILVATARIGAYTPGPDVRRSLTAWLGGIAWRLARRRVQWGHRRFEVLADLSETPSPADAWPTGEQCVALARRRRLLAAILDRLSLERARPFVMRHAFGMSVPEIAAELAINPNTVKSRIARARKDAIVAIERLAATGGG